MALFRVVRVIDGDTFDVPSWQWEDQTGQRVRPTGYNAPEMSSPTGQTVKRKLENLILGQDVELRKAHKIDRGRLICDVYYNGRYLADYFPEYQ